MKILAIATKAPIPPVDGGRLVLRNTLSALLDRGHEIDLVAPYEKSDIPDTGISQRPGLELHLVPVTRRPRLYTAMRSAISELPYSILSHSHAEVTRTIDRLLATARFDVVHVEQLQALRQTERARGPLPPIVLREQNVESALWGDAWGTRAAVDRWRRRQARRLRHWEGEAVSRVSATVALTEPDAALLRELGPGGGSVIVVPAPFPEQLPQAERDLSGDPPFVYLGSQGWPPNRDGWQWFLDRVWPAIQRQLPGAVLHAFGTRRTGADAPGVEWHESARESRECFAIGSILVVPLRFGSGVRIRILEAWARGIPVIATRTAARGLVEDGRDALMWADDPEEFAHSAARLVNEPLLADQLVAAGRQSLRRHYAPASVAKRLEELYEEVSRSAQSGRRAGGAPRH